MEADPAPDRHGARNLPPASRKPLHLAKRVSGRHGEVSRGRQAGGRMGVWVGVGSGFWAGEGRMSTFHNLSYFHTDSNG